MGFEDISWNDERERHTALLHCITVFTSQKHIDMFSYGVSLFKRLFLLKNPTAIVLVVGVLRFSPPNAAGMFVSGKKRDSHHKSHESQESGS